MKKFTENDIFINTIKVHPKIRFFVHSGSVNFNDTKNSGVLLNDFLLGAPGEIPGAIPAGAIITENDEYLLTEDGTYIIIE
jgi:hypothetical protein